MKRGKPLRAKPEKTRAWLERSRKKAAERAQAKARKKKPKRRVGKPLPKTNPKRLRRLRAMQYGTDGKREWVLSMASCVTGRRGTDFDPMTPSHVLGTRANGAGPEGMVPMLASENTDWDSLDEAKWEEHYGVSKIWVRQNAEVLDLDWQAVPAAEKAEWKRRGQRRAA